MNETQDFGKSPKIQLFRPPYGKIKRSQALALQNLGYKIVMWDILSADFDTETTKEKCLENVIANVASGSIIVFHDSKKAFENLQYALPKVLDYLDENKFTYQVLA
jgi:peptidoglycan/xylan/chitin deacetylase (PgdA/CDA1 family)